MNDYESHEIMSQLLEYIELAKSGDSDLSFAEIIIDFSITKDIDLQLISETINDDIYFKKMLMNDCIARNIIKSDSEKLNDW